MIQYYRNNGFTLIEIIVGINLGFLLLTIIVTFFLFSTKFVSTTTKNMDERQKTSDYLIRLESTLRKADQFYFQPLDSGFVCVVNDQDTILFNTHSFSMVNLYKIDKIKEYNIAISFQTGESISIMNGILQESTRGREQNSIIYSSDILDLTIDFSQNNHTNSFYYINPNISINRFRNITN